MTDRKTIEALVERLRQTARTADNAGRGSNIYHEAADALAVLEAEARAARMQAIAADGQAQMAHEARVKSETERDDALAVLEAERRATADMILSSRGYHAFRSGYAGTIGLLCEISPHITDPFDRDCLDEAVADWCVLTGWSWRRTLDRVEVFPPKAEAS